MRTHKEFEITMVWPRSTAPITAENLRFARLEPAVLRERPIARIDAVFAESLEGQITVVPSMIASVRDIFIPHARPIVWPALAAEGLLPTTVAAIERVLERWIREEHVSGAVVSARERLFDPAFGALIEEARALECLGTVDLARVIARAAPALYALRFAGSRRVDVSSEIGGFGALLLNRPSLASRFAIPDPHESAFLARWYPGLPSSQESTFEADVFVGEVTDERDLENSGAWHIRIADRASALAVHVGTPLDDLFVAKVSHRPDDTMLSVQGGPGAILRDAAIRPTAARTGTSGGRIAIVVRSDAAISPDADIDEALALGAALEREGFTVNLTTDPNVLRLEPDLVHGVGLWANNVRLALDTAAGAGIPTAATAALEDFGAGGFWGIVASDAALRSATDEQESAWFLEMLRSGRLSVGTIRLDGRAVPHEGYEAEVKATLRSVGVVFVATETEADYVKSSGRSGEIVRIGPIVDDLGPADDRAMTALTGDGEFVFAHVPLDARSNAVAIVRAALKSEFPVVIAGPDADQVHAAAVRSLGSTSVIVIPEPSPAVAAALYRRARVFVDVSWAPRGLARVARAILCGAPTVVSSQSHAASFIGDSGWLVDPRDSEPLATAIGQAWYASGEVPRAAAAAGRLVESCDAVRAVHRITQGYSDLLAAAVR